mmetsp:Transcript_42466/g.83702  ORF Transcript_42466/g.83702 Transcript_42466/m.83702 type:complete len:202 (-) Transcript_42466:36-641(-)
MPIGLCSSLDFRASGRGYHPTSMVRFKFRTICLTIWRSFSKSKTDESHSSNSPISSSLSREACAQYQTSFSLSFSLSPPSPCRGRGCRSNIGGLARMEDGREDREGEEGSEIGEIVRASSKRQIESWDRPSPPGVAVNKGDGDFLFSFFPSSFIDPMEPEDRQRGVLSVGSDLETAPLIICGSPFNKTAGEEGTELELEGK